MNVEGVYLLKRRQGWGLDTALTPLTPQQSDIGDGSLEISPRSVVTAGAHPDVVIIIKFPATVGAHLPDLASEAKLRWLAH